MRFISNLKTILKKWYITLSLLEKKLTEMNNIGVRKCFNERIVEQDNYRLADFVNISSPNLVFLRKISFSNKHNLLIKF